MIDKINDGIAISLFDITGNMLKPWKKDGYECHIYDIQHPKGCTKREDGFWLHGVDLSEPPDIDGSEVIFASMFPPCTHLAVSGARWFQGKGLRALQESIGYFATCAELADTLWCAWFIENPMSTISTYWRQPDHKFHPCHYSGYDGGSEDFYTKETWLWCSENFQMPPRQMFSDMFAEPDFNYIHNQPPGEERANVRSATPQGFAQAVWEYNNIRNLP